MKQEVAQAILEKIKAYDTIIIHRHQRPDPDALGSQGGLKAILEASFPEKNIYAVGHVPKGLSWMMSCDEVADESYQEALVIVTDTANTPRVSDDRFNKGKYLIKIDHHPNDDAYGDLLWVNPNASSCSEIIYDLYEAQKATLKMTAEAARLLYTGIIGDTGRFMYPSTTQHTLRVAAELIGYDFSQTEINQELDSISAKVAKLSGYVYENMTVLETGAAFVVISQELLEQFELSDAETSAIVPLMGRVEGVMSWAVFIQQADLQYRVRLRSKGPVINELAKAHDGGGHPLASGAKAVDEMEVHAILSELSELVEAYQQVEL